MRFIPSVYSKSGGSLARTDERARTDFIGQHMRHGWSEQKAIQRYDLWAAGVLEANPDMDAAVSAPLLGNGRLHRAIVGLPEHMCADGRFDERIVFFEVPYAKDYAEHLEKLLAAAWCIDTSDWYERGYVYNTRSGSELIREAFGNEETGDLRLFETGCGGETVPAVGPDRIHYARAADVDLFVTPRVAARMKELLAIIEGMYQAAQATAPEVSKCR